MTTRRLLTIGHSYIVGLNRRLAHELARNAPSDWEVTACAPDSLRGDLKPLKLEIEPNEPCRTIPIKAYLGNKIHLMSYDRTLRNVLAEPWDLIHVWEEPYIRCATQIAKWSKGKPLVYYTYQNISKSYPPPFHLFERSNIRQAKGWIAGGHTTHAALINRRGYADRPNCIIPLGVDINHFFPNPEARRVTRKQLGWESPGPPVVGYMGRFVREKGLYVLMRALDQCKQPWRALFLGGGPLLKAIEEWAKLYPGRVAIVPSVAHTEVPAYLNAMDMLVAPSQTTSRWREQLGRMIIEAFACGIPVIASNSGEIPNVVKSAGLLVDEGDVTLWSEAIDRLIHDESERNSLGSAGRERAHSVFAWSNVAQRHWGFFDEVLHRKNTPASQPQWHRESSPDSSSLARLSVRTKPKKLLTIGHSYVLRVNRCLANELQKQSNGKWEVTAIAPKYFHGKNDIRPLDFEFDSNEEIRVEAMQSRLSSRVHLFHYTSSIKSIIREGFDLVHAWEEPYVAVGAQIASSVPKNVPLVFRTAQSLNKSYAVPFNWIERYCVERMSGWMFSGRLVEMNLLKRPGYVERPRCHAPLGFDSTRMNVDRAKGKSVKQRFDWDESIPVIGFLGRFVEDKGIGVIIETLRRLRHPWRAMFVGNGRLLGDLSKLSSEFPGQIALCTSVAHSDVANYINAMDLLLVPSLTMPNWRAQFGRSIVEGFACGVPVIGSDSGEIPHVIGDSGVIVPERDADALCRAITDLLDDPVKRQACIEAGLQRAHEEYTWAKIATKTLEFFDQLLEAKR